MLQTLRRLLTESHGNTCVDVKCDDGVARLFIAGRTIRLCCVRARFIVSKCAVPYGVESRSLGIITPLHVVAARIYLSRLHHP